MYLLDHLNKTSELLVHGDLLFPGGKREEACIESFSWIFFLGFFRVIMFYRLFLLCLWPCCFLCMVRMRWITSGLTTPHGHRFYILGDRNRGSNLSKKKPGNQKTEWLHKTISRPVSCRSPPVTRRQPWMSSSPVLFR